eukprot:TRINITY_DN2567_c0_g1_i1.p1 TRINITY_DN2567_c0_g1~~TRINITY_DN2567_c0_g1_i1.p1  ORF type:complete len:200 (+),score=-18.99 TRINITY_DN2567_c0_g1_i1:402-1001(+)
MHLMYTHTQVEFNKKRQYLQIWALSTSSILLLNNHEYKTKNVTKYQERVRKQQRKAYLSNRFSNIIKFCDIQISTCRQRSQRIQAFNLISISMFVCPKHFFKQRISDIYKFQRMCRQRSQGVKSVKFDLNQVLNILLKVERTRQQHSKYFCKIHFLKDTVGVLLPTFKHTNFKRTLAPNKYTVQIERLTILRVYFQRSH